MAGPYPKLYEPVGIDDATMAVVQVLKKYALCERNDLTGFMGTLNWIEDQHPELEAACDEMRVSITVPATDRELRKFLGIKAFNMIIAGLNNRSASIPRNTRSGSNPLHAALL